MSGMDKRAAAIAILLLAGFASGQMMVSGDTGIGGYATQAHQATQYSMPSQRISSGYNNALLPMPGFARSVLGSERAMVDSRLNDGSTTQFGALTEGGTITQVQEAPYADSTVKIYVTEATIDRIARSANPASELKKAWGTDIRIEGLTLGAQLKLFLANLALGVYFLFVPAATTEGIVPTALATPTAEATLLPTPAVAAPEESEYIDCMGGVGLTASGESITREDRERYSQIVDNITILKQPSKHTCTPTSGAIDLLHWNATIAPGLVNMSAQELIDDLAKRMKTNARFGTGLENAALAMGQYIYDHGYGKNFTVKVYYRSIKPAENRTAGMPVSFIPLTNGVSYYEVRDEFMAGENVIVNMKQSVGGHSMKLIALNTTRQGDGSYLVAFADPETGEVVVAGLSRDGDIEVYQREPYKITSIIAISPKK